MTFILIIAGIVAVILIFKAFVSTKQKQVTNDLNDSLKKIREEVFPNGQKDIDEGTQELLRILNNSVDREIAQTILLKSSCICYITSLNADFSLERLKDHLTPYALHYFNDKSIERFYQFLISKNSRAKNIDTLLDVSREYSKSMNPEGIDNDVMPEGYGEFGLDVTNPIPVRSIPDSYFYLNKLRTQDGSEITYSREGCVETPNIEFPIDRYSILVNGQKVTTIYICPYNKKTSLKTPKGFKLI